MTIDGGGRKLEVVLEVEAAMAAALNHKTTILLDKPLHKRLRQVAKERGTSIGELVRQACVENYACLSDCLLFERPSMAVTSSWATSDRDALTPCRFATFPSPECGRGDSAKAERWRRGEGAGVRATFGTVVGNRIGRFLGSIRTTSMLLLDAKVMYACGVDHPYKLPSLGLFARAARVEP